MQFDQLIRDIQHKKYQPIYLLQGNEPYYIDKIEHAISENILENHEKDFNYSVLYGKDLETNTILQQVKKFPLMADVNITIIKEAKDYKDIDELLSYLQNPSKTSILVICYKDGTIRKNSTIAKAIIKNGIIFNSEKVKDYKLHSWIIDLCKKLQIKISNNDAHLLAEHLGNDLNKIETEFKKLKIAIPNLTEIDKNIIETHIGISKDYNVFELQKALSERNHNKVMKIVNYFSKNEKKQPLPMVLAFLYGYFSKIIIYQYNTKKTDAELCKLLGVAPYFLDDYKKVAKTYKARKTVEIISLLREYDMKFKGVKNGSANQGQLYTELFSKIIF